MDYQKALGYVLSFADFERWPGAGYAERWDLDRMEELLKRLGSPHKERKTVHIAGSKGKGSTAAMIASVLSTAGFKTGLYTSPHLHTMRERIRIGDELINEQEFADIVSKMELHVGVTNQNWEGTLSTFEILTALAFVHYQKSGADFQVLETGLGGRLDATNVTIPDVCVLTSVSLDHTAVLGDTIAEITAEKAGIVKSGVPVVSSPQVAEAIDVIREVCSEKGSRLIIVGEDITWEGQGPIIGKQSIEVKGLKGKYAFALPLVGEHQIENATAAVGALEIFDINSNHVESGLANVRWPGRLEILREEPLLIADGAHNGDSARRLVDSLKQHFEFDRSILIIGTSADKNSSAIVAEFAPFFDRVITTNSQHPRANDSRELAAEFSRYGVEAYPTDNVGHAVAKALNQAGTRDLICGTGSLFLVAEVIEEARGFSGERYPTKETPR